MGLVLRREACILGVGGATDDRKARLQLGQIVIIRVFRVPQRARDV
jgi:hypothetical protein